MSLLLALCLTLAHHASAADLPRVRENLDFNWRFLQADVPGAQEPAFDDSQWRQLDLPHDWSIEGEYKQDHPSKGACAYLPYGIGWYRRVLEMPASVLNRRFFIEFDAASMVSEVWLNGQFLGKRHYSGISFAYELTPHLKAGRNVLAVRIDNSLVPNGRWYTGSGLYSHVFLLAVNPIHVAQWGTFVTTPHVSAERALVQVQTQLANQTAEPVELRLVSEVNDETGKSLAQSKSLQRVEATNTATLSQSLPLPSPRLWSPQTPHLYTLVSRVYRGQQLQDEYRTPFGVRTLRFDAQTGFWLNEKNLKLAGVGIHYCAGPMGVALPDKVLRGQLLQLKAMGCNVVRTGTHAFPPLFYDLCDQLGLMVIDEAFDGWRRKAAHDYGAEAFAQHWQQDLTDMVRRDRNHPSVILWSIGNETGEQDRFGLTPFVHQLDATRPTTGGQCLLGVDVSGFTGRGEVPGVLDQFHREHPEQPILLIEETHGYQTRGYYRTLTWWRDSSDVNPHQPFPPYATTEVFPFGGDPQYNSSYDNSTVRLCARMCWQRTRETPWIAGECHWAGFDYLGEASFAKRHWPARYGNPGLIDSGGIPKDIYYFYQSQWTSEPMLHLLPHWTHPLVAPGTKIPVVAYSNCEEVELFLDGRSLGRQKPREWLDFLWPVPYEPGELKAVGYRQGAVVASHAFHTAGVPAEIKLERDQASLAADRRDVTTVTFSVRDKAGELVPWAHDRLEFKLLGPARLLGYENGDNLDVTPHRVGWRKVFGGLGRGFFAATTESGPVELTAAGILGNRRFQDATTVSLAVTRLSLRGPLPPATLALHYTTDGSEPTAASPRYESPFTLHRPTTVRLLVLRDGQPFLRSEAQFEQGPPLRFEDPRFEQPSTATALALPPDFARQPRDPEAAGLWREGNRRFRFAPDGTVYEIEAAQESAVAQWWYDFPDDSFESPNAVGSGQLRWLDSGKVLPLRLETSKAKTLLLLRGKQPRRFVREESRSDTAPAQ